MSRRDDLMLNTWIIKAYLFDGYYTEDVSKQIVKMDSATSIECNLMFNTDCVLYVYTPDLVELIIDYISNFVFSDIEIMFEYSDGKARLRRSIVTSSMDISTGEGFETKDKKRLNIFLQVPVHRLIGTTFLPGILELNSSINMIQSMLRNQPRVK